MTNKMKTIYPNNLLSIREQQHLTQKQMGEILGVGERMISNYETGVYNLPLDKAAYKKWLFGLTGGIGIVAFLATFLIWLI